MHKCLAHYPVQVFFNLTNAAATPSLSSLSFLSRSFRFARASLSSSLTAVAIITSSSSSPGSHKRNWSSRSGAYPGDSGVPAPKRSTNNPSSRIHLRNGTRLSGTALFNFPGVSFLPSLLSSHIKMSLFLSSPHRAAFLTPNGSWAYHRLTFFSPHPLTTATSSDYSLSMMHPMVRDTSER